MIRIAHFADVHLDETTREQVEPALAELGQQIEQEEPDLIVFSGDLYVRRGHLSPRALLVARSHFADLARIAPFVVIPGNHDLQHRLGPDSVTASFSRLVGENILAPSDDASPIVFDRPGTVTLAGVQIVALPYPSRYLYIANKLQNGSADISRIDEEISAALNAVVQGMVAHLDPEKPAVLVWHGTVEGGLADNEQMMSTTDDIALRRGGLLDRFDAVLAGHLHRRQDVGNVHYPGSIAPLTFADTDRRFGWTLWDLRERREDPPVEMKLEFRELPVAHPMIDLKIGSGVFGPGADDPGLALAEVVRTFLDRTDGTVTVPQTAHLRVILELPDEDVPRSERLALEEYLSRRVWRHKIVSRPPERARARVSEVSAEMKPDELIRRYAALHGDEFADPDVQALIDLNRDIDGKIPAEERMRFHGASYEPRRIAWRDYKPLGEGEIRFDELGKLVCVAGENTAGKSNLAELERFALWKATRGSPLVATIRDHEQGARSCQVEFEFECAGGIFRVIRSAKATSRGATGEVVVQRLEQQETGEPRWVPENWGDSTETQRKLEELVGSYDLYLATRFRSQFDIDRLLNLRPAELKDTVLEAIGIQLFDRRRSLANDWLKDIQAERSLAVKKLAEFEELVRRRPALDEELTSKQTDVGKLGIERTRLEGSRREIQEKISKLGETLVALEGLEREHRDVVARYTKAEHERRDLEERRDRLTEITANADEIREGVREVGELRERISDLDGKKRELDELRQMKTEKERELERALADHRMKIAEVEARARQLSRRKEDLEKRHALIGEVERSVGCTEQECPLLQDAYAAGRELAKVLAEISETYREGEELRKADPTAAYEPVIAGLEHSMAEVPYSDAERQKAKARLAGLVDEGWEGLERELLQAEATLGEIAGRLMKLTEEADTLDARRKELRARIDATGDPEAIRQEQETLRRQDRALDSEIREVQTHIDEGNRLIGEICSSLEAINRAEVEQAELIREDRKNAEQERLLRLYVRAMGRDGIPFLFLEQALPLIERQTNWFLGADLGLSPLAVRIAPMRDTQSGTTRDEVTITFSDEKGQDFPLRELSGQQRVAVGTSLSAAVAQTQAEVAGVRVYHFWQDEGFGSYDPQNRGLAKVMIRRLADTFERFLYVTHVPEMIEVADTVIWVERNPMTGSTIRLGGA